MKRIIIIMIMSCVALTACGNNLETKEISSESTEMQILSKKQEIVTDENKSILVNELTSEESTVFIPVGEDDLGDAPYEGEEIKYIEHTEPEFRVHPITGDIVNTKTGEITNAIPRCVMVNNVIYKDTGYISSIIGCGNMDGMIDSKVDINKMPEKNNQSNFDDNLLYQYGSNGCIYVVIDNYMHIFRDIEHTDDDIPMEVANFDAKIVEINEGSMIVSYISQPGIFLINQGDYEVPLTNLQEEVEIGDIVTVWFNGMVMESDPAYLGGVYRISKMK